MVIVDSQHEFSELLPHFQNLELEFCLEMSFDTVLSVPKLSIICTGTDLITSYFSAKENYGLCKHLFSHPEKFYIIGEEK